MATFAEENYLKAIFNLSGRMNRSVSTNEIASELHTRASSVTDMLKKLAEKRWIHYQKYQGVTLTKKGRTMAALIVRKHRLWEVFLVEKLNFGWDEIHEVAEQLEHIHSEKLIERLAEFLGHPEFDPHGDPIPGPDGKMAHHKGDTMHDMAVGERAEIVGVAAHTTAFLQYLDSVQLLPGTQLTLSQRFAYDQSLVIELNNGHQMMVSDQVSRKLLVRYLP
jgi:DtxR family transcriptional regulator, Mn-dependent transcriptional regulator